MKEQPPTAGPPPGKRPNGRPRLPDPRRHGLRIRCNDEELLKLRILSKLNHDLNISTMARDIVLDELNALLAESPRHELIATLQTHGLTARDIESLLKSI